MPGVSTKAAIQENHSRMVMKEACTGKTLLEEIQENDEIEDPQPQLELYRTFRAKS